MTTAEEAPIGLRDRKKRRTRASIVRAGIELFAERGFKETTVSDIAARAEIAPRTFFAYFKRKDELLFEEQREGARIVAEALADRTDGQSTVDVLDRIWVGASSVIPDPETLRLRRMRYQVVASEPRLQGPDHSEYADAIRQPLYESFRLDLDHLTPIDRDTRARLLTGITIGLVMESVYITRESVVGDTRKEDADFLSDVFRRGFEALRAVFATLAVD